MEEERKLYPLKFTPLSDNAVWGEEKWLLADLGWRDSEISNGWLKGNTIGEIMDMYCDDMTGDEVFSLYGRQFPLMVKQLDVRGRLPLLAHPDDGTAVQRYDLLGKEKIWYVLKAGPDARLWLGMKEDVSAYEFWDACQSGRAESLLNEVVPHDGDVYRIYPGMVHGAGDGVVILEVSESSDLDFALYNWGRDVESESDLPLTLSEAIDFLDFKAYDPAKCAPDECEMFILSKVVLENGMQVSSDEAPAFEVYICLDGEAGMRVRGEEETVVKKGEVVLVPADLDEFLLVPRASGTVLLEAIWRKPVVER
ncbi:MAG: class I mannose-6-phosphate isomerase [Bacteroidales bacterium]|nr:class I mannose-6-phosphate isomerase [Bacteroidales bacterium]